MKKIFLLGSVISFVLLLSFTMVSCITTSSNSGISTAPLRWTAAEFRNEWGDGLGIYFVQYDGRQTASLTNSGGTQNIQISEISYSHQEGLTFRTPSFATTFGNTPVNVIIRNQDGTENNFSGIWSDPTTPFVFVPASDELVIALSENGSIIRVSSQTSRFQFRFPDRFSEAYERLVERERR